MAPEKNALAARIREFLEWGRYTRRFHFETRGRERQISDPEVFMAIDTGDPVSDATWDAEHENWRITLAGEVDDGVLVLGLAVDLDREWVYLITAFVREA
jgi:hypothetical protein